MPPPATGSVVVEPFAGSAAYATRYEPEKALLLDMSPHVVGVWRYLIRESAASILALPDLLECQTVKDLNVCEEAKALIGFWVNSASAAPGQKMSKWARGATTQLYWGSRVRERLATQVEKIRRWKVHCESYENAPDIEATWFIDPPYQCAAGRLYPHNTVDFDALGAWCKTRRGAVYVCESSGATWLPFEPFARMKSNSGRRGKGYSDEMLWQK